MSLSDAITSLDSFIQNSKMKNGMNIYFSDDKHREKVTSELVKW